MRIAKQILLFIFLVLFQVFVLNQIGFRGYMNPYIYIAFLIFFSPAASSFNLVLFGFLLGLSVDFFENSLGVHTFAATFLGFTRNTILYILVDKQDIKNGDFHFANINFVSLVLLISVSSFLFHWALFSVESFTFMNYGLVLLRTLYSTVFSSIFLLFYFYLSVKRFKPV